MNKTELLELLDKNKNTEPVELHGIGDYTDGYDDNDFYCVVYINDDNYCHTSCIDRIRLHVAGNEIEWILISVETMREFMNDKENEWAFRTDFFFEYEEGNEEEVEDSCPLKIYSIDREYITLVPDKDFDEHKYKEERKKRK